MYISITGLIEDVVILVTASSEGKTGGIRIGNQIVSILSVVGGSVARLTQRAIRFGNQIDSIRSHFRVWKSPIGAMATGMPQAIHGRGRIDTWLRTSANPAISFRVERSGACSSCRSGNLGVGILAL